MENWKGKRIVITGATRGIGFESAKLFLAAGAEVFGTGRDPKRLEACANELNKIGTFHPFLAEWEDPTAPERTANAIAKVWDSIDVLANNAAVQTWKADWYAEDPDLLERQMRINVLAPNDLTRLLVPLLLKGTKPRIVNVGSGAGCFAALQSSPDMPTYRLTKYALGGLTLLWAAQLKGKVAVNVLDPGWLKTDLGGPNAPGEPADGGQRMWEICHLPWENTGKFWHGDREIQF